MIDHPHAHEEFVSTLNNYLHPSAPIQSEELLRGRKEQLINIKKALSSPGRNAFIYGERGVGKTSVAHTAAYLHQSAEASPIFITCDRNSTCFSICHSSVKSFWVKDRLNQKLQKAQNSALAFLAFLYLQKWQKS